MVATAARYTRLAELVLPILRPGWSAISSDLTLEPHGKTESLRFAVVVPVGGVFKKTEMVKKRAIWLKNGCYSHAIQ